MDRPPGQIKVFGILHLVFAAIGTLGVLASVVMKPVTEKMYEAQEKMGGQQEIQARMSRELVTSMEPVTYFQYGASVLLTVLLVLAGLGLLKRRAGGLKYSNAYAWTAIGLRLLTVVLALVYVLPRMSAAMEGVIKGSGAGKETETALAITKFSMMAGIVIGPLMYCIYPVLVLVFLNRRSVKAALG